MQPGAVDDEKREGGRDERRREDYRKTHDDEHCDISFGVRSREFASSKTSKRGLSELPDVRLLATLYPLCAPFHRDIDNERGGEEVKKTTGADARRTTRKKTTMTEARKKKKKRGS